MMLLAEWEERKKHTEVYERSNGCEWKERDENNVKNDRKNAQFPRQLAACWPKRWGMRCIKISLPEILHFYPFRRPAEQEQDWNLYFLHIQFNLFFMAWNSHQHANTNQIHGILYKIFSDSPRHDSFLSLSLSSLSNIRNHNLTPFLENLPAQRQRDKPLCIMKVNRH